MMKKEIVAIGLMILLTACGQSDTVSQGGVIDISLNEITVKALETLTFDDELTLIETEGGIDVIGISKENVVEGEIYMSSGASAEIFAVFKSENSEKAQVVSDEIEEYVLRLHDEVEDYQPEEVSKIDDAQVGTDGSFAYLIISNDSETAEEVVDTLFND